MGIIEFKLGDKRLIALFLVVENLGLDSKRHLFKQLPASLASQIDHALLNRQLAPKLAELRQHMHQACCRPKALLGRPQKAT